MVVTVGAEVVGVLGVVAGGAGGGLWFDTERREGGPYAYLLGGAGLGAFGGASVELGWYRDRDSLRGLGLELGGAAGTGESAGVNLSFGVGPRDRRNSLAGLAGNFGLGGGGALWALASVAWTGVFGLLSRWLSRRLGAPAPRAA